MYIEYNLEANPLQIRTDSLVGSRDLISIAFYTEAEANTSKLAGGIKILFADPPTYRIFNCNSWSELENVPEAQVRKYHSDK